MADPQKILEPMQVIYPNAAGLDIGRTEIMVAIPPDRAGETVRGFGTYTPDLKELANWLAESRVTHVAMESTGVYWMSSSGVIIR